jgi:hypothetical protein
MSANVHGVRIPRSTDNDWFRVRGNSCGGLRVAFVAMALTACSGKAPPGDATSVSTQGDTGSSPTSSEGATAHFATLRWTASTSPGVTYELLRATRSGGPYTQIQSGLKDNSATDHEVTSGVTYYYVARSEDANGQSVNSNQVEAVIP